MSPASTFTTTTTLNAAAYLAHGRTSHSQQALLAVEAYLQREHRALSASEGSTYLPAVTLWGKLLSCLW